MIDDYVNLAFDDDIIITLVESWNLFKLQNDVFISHLITGTNMNGLDDAIAWNGESLKKN